MNFKEKEIDLKDHLRSLGNQEIPPKPETPILSSHEAPFSITGIRTGVVIIAADEKTGRGFVVDGEGKIVTNFLLVESASRIKVTTFSGDIFLGKVVRKDSIRDLALVQIPANTSANYLILGDSSSIDVGEDVFVLGKSFRTSGDLTKGVVTALRRVKGTALIQIDIPIDPADSGGPVVTGQGTVVGMTSFKLGRNDNTTFAVSVNELRAFVFGS